MTLRVQTQKAPVFTKSLRVYGSGIPVPPFGRLFVCSAFAGSVFQPSTINHQLFFPATDRFCPPIHSEDMNLKTINQPNMKTHPPRSPIEPAAKLQAQVAFVTFFFQKHVTNCHKKSHFVTRPGSLKVCLFD